MRGGCGLPGNSRQLSAMPGLSRPIVWQHMAVRPIFRNGVLQAEIGDLFVCYVLLFVVICCEFASVCLVLGSCRCLWHEKVAPRRPTKECLCPSHCQMGTVTCAAQPTFGKQEHALAQRNLF